MSLIHLPTLCDPSPPIPVDVVFGVSALCSRTLLTMYAVDWHGNIIAVFYYIS